MKINGQDIKAKEFAYDGCHKIYLIESKEDREEAWFDEYEILPIEKLQKIFNKSCNLRFISSWSLSKSYVNQFEEVEFEA